MKGEMLRLVSPMTISRLIDYFQVTKLGRANIGRPKYYWVVLIELKRGIEKKPYKDYKIGDILYCPQQDAIYLYYGEGKISLPVTFIGRITEGIEMLPDMRNGTMTKVSISDISKNV